MDADVNQGSIEGIDWYLTADAFSTHDAPDWVVLWGKSLPIVGKTICLFPEWNEIKASNCFSVVNSLITLHSGSERKKKNTDYINLLLYSLLQDIEWLIPVHTSDNEMVIIWAKCLAQNNFLHIWTRYKWHYFYKFYKNLFDKQWIKRLNVTSQRVLFHLTWSKYFNFPQVEDLVKI